MNRWDQPAWFVLVNRDTLYKILCWQRLLTIEYLQIHFTGWRTLFPQFGSNKYSIFHWDLPGVHTNLLNILKHIQKVKHQVLFFYSRCVFCNYTLSFYNCILYSHSPDNLGQPTQMIKSAKIVHVLNFKTTTYLIIKQLQRVYENQSIVFPEWKRSAKARVLRG